MPCIAYWDCAFAHGQTIVTTAVEIPPNSCTHIARIISKPNSGWGSHVNDLQNDSKLPSFLPLSHPFQFPSHNCLRRQRKNKGNHFKTAQLWMRQLSGANEATGTKFALHFKCTKIETKKCQLQMDKFKQKKNRNKL